MILRQNSFYFRRMHDIIDLRRHSMDGAMQSSTVCITNTIIFEQPLNDPIRICLRLENLFDQFQHHINNPSLDSSKAAMSALLRTLNVIERPDLKSKLTQALTQHASSLGQLEQFSQVDSMRLQALLAELDKLIRAMHENRGKIGESLRNNDFLNQIRINLGNPGGACDYTSPAYALWLRQPGEKRMADLQTWAKELVQLQTTIRIMLKLTREGTSPKIVICDNGFYQQALDHNLPCEMIRVKLPTDYNVYPEFSVGRHRLSIRFVTPNFYGTSRPTQVNQKLEFELTCCRS